MNDTSIIMYSANDVPPHGVRDIMSRMMTRGPACALRIDVNPEVSPAFDLVNISIETKAHGRAMFSQNLSSTAIAAEFLGYTMIEPWRMTDDDATDLVFTIQNISDRPHRFRASVRSVTPPAAEKGPKGGTITSCHPVGFGSAEVEPGATVHLLARPQVVFRGDALAIADAEHFEIVDLIVGNRSQMGRAGGFPKSQAIGPTARAYRRTIDTAAVAQDITLVLKNVSAQRRLARAALWGTAAFL